MPARSRIICGDALSTLRTLPDESIHCVVTSPPYYGLRDYGHKGQIGLEETPQAYVAKLVEVFREVRRVLRQDATLWLNLGDSYTGGGGGNYSKSYKQTAHGQHVTNVRNRETWLDSVGMGPKQLLGIPWRVAFALQDDGWILRQDIIWHNPAPMPSSARDRCCKSHEYVFLLAKNTRYYFDQVAISEPASDPKRPAQPGYSRSVPGNPYKGQNSGTWGETGQRIKRSVWKIPGANFKGSHFATFPKKLVEPCLMAGCPHKVCPECGSPWVREVKRERYETRPGTNTKYTGDSMKEGNRNPKRPVTTTETLGWNPSCECGREDTLPGIVLDPFFGAGTVGVVAQALARDYVGIELNPKYAEMARKRIARSPGPGFGLFGH